VTHATDLKMEAVWLADQQYSFVLMLALKFFPVCITYHIFLLSFCRIQLSGSDPPKAFSTSNASETDSSDEEETPEERGNLFSYRLWLVYYWRQWS
jgi:hypothetical protein